MIRIAGRLAPIPCLYWPLKCTILGMQVQIRWIREKQSEAFARFHRIVCDQPFTEEGMDAGMTPPELMLSALGCCSMYYASEYLKTRRVSPHSIEITVKAEKSAPPARLTNFQIEVSAPGLTARLREGVLKSIEACLLGRTLAQGSPVQVKPVEPAVQM